MGLYFHPWKVLAFCPLPQQKASQRLPPAGGKLMRAAGWGPFGRKIEVFSPVQFSLYPWLRIKFTLPRQFSPADVPSAGGPVLNRLTAEVNSAYGILRIHAIKWRLTYARRKTGRDRPLFTGLILVVPLAADKIHIVPPVFPSRCSIGRGPRIKPLNGGSEFRLRNSSNSRHKMAAHLRSQENRPKPPAFHRLSSRCTPGCG